MDWKKEINHSSLINFRKSGTLNISAYYWTPNPFPTNKF